MLPTLGLLALGFIFGAATVFAFMRHRYMRTTPTTTQELPPTISREEIAIPSVIEAIPDPSPLPLRVLLVGLPITEVEAGRYTLGKPDIPPTDLRQRFKLYPAHSAAEAYQLLEHPGDYDVVITALGVHSNTPNEFSGCPVNAAGIEIAVKASMLGLPCVIITHEWRWIDSQHETILGHCIESKTEVAFSWKGALESALHYR